MDHSGHGMMMDLPPFTLGRGLEWSADPFFLVACAAGLALYGWGSYDCGGAGTRGRPGGRCRTSSACSPSSW